MSLDISFFTALWISRVIGTTTKRAISFVRKVEINTEKDTRKIERDLSLLSLFRNLFDSEEKNSLSLKAVVMRRRPVSVSRVFQSIKRGYSITLCGFAIESTMRKAVKIEKTSSLLKKFFTFLTPGFYNKKGGAKSPPFSINS